MGNRRMMLLFANIVSQKMNRKEQKNEKNNKILERASVAHDAAQPDADDRDLGRCG